MQIAKIVTIVRIPFATAETGKNKMTGKHALIPRNDFPNDKIASRPGVQGPGPDRVRQNLRISDRTGPGPKIENLGPVRP